jgi:hypothetical protein
MRRILSQIVILILFLFLTVFAAVWFEDTGGDEEREVERAHSLLWLVQAGKKTWQIIDGISNLSPESYQAENAIENEDSGASIDDSEMLVMAGDAMALAENFDTSYSEDGSGVVDGSFREFLANIFKKAPERYLDTKIYSNGWRNFGSLYWLKYQELKPE